MELRESKASPPPRRPRKAVSEPAARAAQPAARRAKHDEPDAELLGVRISHPGRILFAEMGASKLDLARYYESVAEPLLAHLRGRPLSLIRCPRGSEKACFFQKHVEHAPVGTHKVSIAEEGEATDELLVVESIEGVIGLVQFGAIEFHTWGALEASMEQPDRITLVLDPDPSLNWKVVLEAAGQVRELIQALGLPSFVKTTGGKGLHIVVPLQIERPWGEVRAFSRALAEHIAAEMPQRFTARLAKVSRQDKIFIDYLRNAREATTVCAFSARARHGAPVSMTLAWDALEPRIDVRGEHFNIANAAHWIATRGEDPWASFADHAVRLTGQHFSALGIEAPGPLR